MKSKCSYIFKASTALLLALLMLFGTMAGSVAAVVENGGFAAPVKAEQAAPADTAAAVEEAEPEAIEPEGIEPEEEEAEPDVDVPAQAPGFDDVLRDKADFADTGADADLAETGHNSGGYILFDAGRSGWTSATYMYFLYYSNDNSWWNQCKMTKITGTDIWCIDMDDDSDNHGNIAFAASSSDLSGWTNNQSYTYRTNKKDYTTNNSDYYLAYASAASTTATLNIGAAGGGTDYTKKIADNTSYKYNQTVKVGIKAVGASTYTEKTSANSATGGNVALSGKQWDAWNTIKSASSTSSNYSSQLSNAARTTYVTLSTHTNFTGYTLDGWYSGLNSGSSYTYSTGYKVGSSATTTYARYTETSRTVTVACGSNGKTSIDNSTFDTTNKTVNAGITTTANIYAQADAGYRFTGWTVTSGTSSDVTFGDASSASTTVKTKSNVTITANFASDTVTLRVFARRATGTNTVYAATNYTKTADATEGTTAWSALALSGAGDHSISTEGSVTLSQTTPSGYRFMGWYKTATKSTSTIAFTTALVSTSSSYTVKLSDGMDVYYYAMYRAIYSISAFDSYEYDYADGMYTETKTSSPPATVVVTRPGSTNTTHTFTYSATETKGYSTTKSNYTNNSSVTYGEGNRLYVLCGDTVRLNYPGLASSDAISAAFYTTTATASVYTAGSVGTYLAPGFTTSTTGSFPYTGSNTGCMKAIASYYSGDIATTISGANYDSSNKIDASNHYVEFRAMANRLNITIDLGMKYRVFLSESDNIEVQSKNIDNFYESGEDMSGSSSSTYFTVKAAGNANLTNYMNKSATTHSGISYTGFKYYYCDKNGNFTDASGNAVSTPVEIASCPITVASGTASYNSGTTAGSAIRFGGTMPATNVYIDLGLKQEVTVKHGSVMVSDTSSNGYTGWSQAAEIKVRKNANASNSSNTVNGSGSGAGVTNETYSNGINGDCQNIVAADEGYVTYVWDYWKPSSSNGNQVYADSYMFVGWYKGDATAPDYTHGFISDKTFLKYTPKENVTIWAVGTRDMFINGGTNIVGSDWPDNNIKMEFDADYVDANTGNRGRYRYTVTTDMFQSTAPSGTPEYKKGTLGGTADNGTYWSDGGDSTVNSKFKFYDTKLKSGSTNIWSGIKTFYNSTGDNGLKFGKAGFYNDRNNVTNLKAYGCGFLEFKESSFPGYSAPIYIYYYPGADGFSVESTYIYTNIYMSNGYKVGGTDRDGSTGHNSTYSSKVVYMNGSTESTSSTYMEGPNGNGWTPNHEGNVGHYRIKIKEGTARVKKTCASTEKVSAFFVYDLYDNTVHAVRDVSVSSNTYYADIKMKVGHDLYIVPVIEVKTANMTVYFDATQLNTERWGKIVSCYAWYSDGSNTPALGDFPGQPMIPSDDGNSWVATFPDTYTSGDTTYRLAGITFSNYVDGNHSWLGYKHYTNNVLDDTIMDTVTYSNAGTDSQTYTLGGDGKVHLYNAIGAAPGTTKYEKVNCKVQTYDYRDPISYYTNYVNEGGTDITLTFSIKMGNSDDVMSLKHSELKSSSAKLFSSVPHTNSSGNSEPKKFTSSNFEYLTNAKHDRYVDLNGADILDENGQVVKPTATYYVLAKGQVVYKNGSLKQVFWSGSRNESDTSLSYYNTNLGAGTNTVPTGAGAVNETYPLSDSSISRSDITNVAESYGVEWYVYDASGNYITNVLAAGFADNATTASNCTDSIIGAKLRSMGYAVDGKAVAICYDKPRSLTTDDESGGTKYINSGTEFDAYRATGQWYRTTQLQPVTVTARVGMMTDSGEVVSKNNSEGYGTATAAYITAKGSTNGSIRAVAAPTPLNSEYGAVTTALKDAENTPVRLTATSTNFIGWYYYDEGTGKFTKAKYEDPTNFYPNYTKDITFYAMYKASAIYRYGYLGREGQKYYTVSGGDLTAAEMSAGNAPSTDRSDVTGSGGKAPVGKMTVFKQTLDFSKNASGATYSASDYSNNVDEYYLDIANCKKTAETYTVTAYYKNASGTQTSVTQTAVYNGQALDLKNGSGVPYASLYTAKEFVGWYAYDNSTVGELLSTNRNFGMRLTRNQAIIAKYKGEKTLPTAADTWHAYIDENEVTREMYSADSGMFYNDTIVRLRNDNGVLTSLPSGAEVGVILISDNKSGDTTTRTTAQLTGYANALSNGQSGKIKNTNLSATKASTSNVTIFNRADLAIRGDYKTMVGACYSVYAYIKLSNGTYVWSDPITKSDAATAYPAVP